MIKACITGSGMETMVSTVADRYVMPHCLRRAHSNTVSRKGTGAYEEVWLGSNHVAVIQIHAEGHIRIKVSCELYNKLCRIPPRHRKNASNPWVGLVN